MSSNTATVLVIVVVINSWVMLNVCFEMLNPAGSLWRCLINGRERINMKSYQRKAQVDKVSSLTG